MRSDSITIGTLEFILTYCNTSRELYMQPDLVYHLKKSGNDETGVPLQSVMYLA